MSQCIAGGIQLNLPVWEILSNSDSSSKLPTFVADVRYAIHAGDVVDASVAKSGDAGKYDFAIHDNGSGGRPAWTWTTTQTQKDGGALPPTAEWIIEHGSGVLGPVNAASFGTIAFTGCSYGPSLDVSTALAVVAVGTNGPLTRVSGTGGTISVAYLRSS